MNYGNDRSLDLKKNKDSQPLKSGEPALKVRPKSVKRLSENATRRLQMEVEQGVDDYQNAWLGHHQVKQMKIDC